ncbi:MAG: hypothetical protein LBC39_06320 [Methanobrevibacter sp.]|jgi:hypothetical protein|nr:hypothetical protein [Candidatus Methanovirga aequatorialis]
MVDIHLGIPKDIDKYFYNRKEELDRLNLYTDSLKKGIPMNILMKVNGE